MRNKWLRFSLILVGFVLALGIVFGAGIFVGRASGRVDGLRPVRWFALFFNGAHGAVGRVEKIEGQTVTLVLRDGSSQTVLVDQETRIEKSRQRITTGDLHQGDAVQVIGSPDNSGRIKARWVRVMTDPGGSPPDANQGKSN
jgi:hypothetical protein